MDTGDAGWSASCKAISKKFETEVTIMSVMPETKSIKDGIVYFGWLCALTVVIAVIVAVTL